MTEHRALYKNSALDAKELRRRREEDSVQLRRQKRQDVLSKRRTIAPMPDNDEEETRSDDDGDEFAVTKDVIAAINQDEDQQLLIDYAQKVRKMLSKEPQPPFDEVIHSGLIPRFIELLDRNDNTLIQFEVAWILTNICSGTTEHTRVVVDHGAVPKLVSLLGSPDMRVSEQAVWALGNIVGEGAQFRDLVISHGFVPALLALIRPDLDIGFLRNETWVLVNLCRNKDPPPTIEIIQQIVPALCYLIQSSDLAILIDTAWAISYITELGPHYAQIIIDSNLVSHMTPLLSHKEIKIQTAAIRALGSTVTGDENQTQAVIDAGALPHLCKVLKENKDRVVKETLWFLSNICAGSTNQIQAIIDNQLLPAIVFHLDNGDFHQQKEAAWTIYNFTLSGTTKQIQLLVEENVIPPLCRLLKTTDTGVLRNLLEIIQCILNACEDNRSDICDAIDEHGGLDLIEMLQSHPTEDIYEFAYSIIDQYFSANGDGEVN